MTENACCKGNGSPVMEVKVFIVLAVDGIMVIMVPEMATTTSQIENFGYF